MVCCLTEKNVGCFSRLKEANPWVAGQDQPISWLWQWLRAASSGTTQEKFCTYLCFPLGFWPPTVVSLGASRAEYGFSDSRHFYSSIVGFYFLKFFILLVSTSQHVRTRRVTAKLLFSSFALLGVLVLPGFFLHERGNRTSSKHGSCSDLMHFPRVFSQQTGDF